MFEGAVSATFDAFGIDAVYIPANGDPISMRVIARRPTPIVGFGETRIHAETATFEIRARAKSDQVGSEPARSPSQPPDRVPVSYRVAGRGSGAGVGLLDLTSL